MTVAKGHIDENHNYVYTCWECNGTGQAGYTNKPQGLYLCPDCCGLDYERLIKEFETAKGERYYALLKAILSIKGKSIYDRAVEIHKANGKFTPIDYVRLMLEFNFPKNRLKPLAEWLEECKFSPYGTYDSLRDRGFKVKDALARLKAENDTV